jgi:hypothetical protein
MIFAKDNAAVEGLFNRWTINGMAYPMSNAMARPRHFTCNKVGATASTCATRATMSTRFTSTAIASS